jgi:hypothetical protein
VSDEKAAYALGYLREWVRKLGEPTYTVCGDKKQMHTINVELPLQYLDVLDKSFDYYVRTLGAYAQKQLQPLAAPLDKRTREEREAEGEKDE